MGTIATLPQGGQQVIIRTAPQTGPKRYEGLQSKAVIVLGSLQITTGILCIIFQIVAIVIDAQAAQLAHGIWGGVIFLIAGVFGVVAATQKTLCPIVTFMVLSIISACAAVPVLAFASIGLLLDDRYACDYFGNGCTDGYKTKIAMQWLLIALPIFEGIIAIISASLCCHGICCCGNNNQGAVLSYPQQNVQYVTTGQPGALQPQVIVMQNPGQFQSGQQPPPTYHEKPPLQ